jgi:hypothetical protein
MGESPARPGECNDRGGPRLGPADVAGWAGARGFSSGHQNSIMIGYGFVAQSITHPPAQRISVRGARPDGQARSVRGGCEGEVDHPWRHWHDASAVWLRNVFGERHRQTKPTGCPRSHPHPSTRPVTGVSFGYGLGRDTWGGGTARPPPAVKTVPAPDLRRSGGHCGSRHEHERFCLLGSSTVGIVDEVGWEEQGCTTTPNVTPDFRITCTTPEIHIGLARSLLHDELSPGRS